MITSKDNKKDDTEQNIKKSRQKKTSVEYQKNKSLVIQDKLQNPNKSIYELEKKYNVSKSTIDRDIKRELRDVRDKNLIIVENAKNSLVVWLELFTDKVKELKTKDIQSISDLNSLSQSLKSNQSIINMIEWATESQNNSLPWQINIQIINKND